MRPHLPPMRRLSATSVLMLLVLVALSSPMSAQEPSPSPSPLLSPSPSLDLEAVAPPEPAVLGGAWRRTAAGPFGGIDLPGGWTGTEIVVVDPEQKRRAAAYYPALDTWRAIARPPRKVDAGSAAHWTGTELLFVEPKGSARHGLVAYDPVADAWRSTAPSPFNTIADSVWADGVLVVTTGPGDASGMYDPASDTWAELPAVPVLQAATDTPREDATTLHWTGEELYALTTAVAAAGDASAAGEASLAVVPLDIATGEWGAPSVGPLSASAAAPLWTGDWFVFLTNRDDLGTSLEGPPADGLYDPETGTWSVTENACGIDTSSAVWTGSLILAASERRAYDPAADLCSTLPVSPWPARSGALQVWTGGEVLGLSGLTAEGSKPRRDGLAYSPIPEAGSLGVAVDTPSRPVRVRVPSLGIDLPVVSDERRVRGSTPGYPACDVALSWSAFDLPGAPGTAWVLAHAQEGMFLPLLEQLRTEGPSSLLGRRVELQLRDGRLFTYRTYRVDPRATDAHIGTNGRRPGEHRLVLQTSTGVGSAPKLLVAARLVDVASTDETRPRPEPRACG